LLSKEQQNKVSFLAKENITAYKEARNLSVRERWEKLRFKEWFE